MQMSTLFDKIGLGLRTYWRARSAIKMQFHPEEITRAQNAKLRTLINHSFNNIKYYRELFEKARIKPDHIRTVEDLKDIPILTKQELRNRFWDFLPSKLLECRVSRTSGSTGIPVCILSDRNARMFNSAAVIRYRKALGIPLIGRPILTLLKTEDDPPRESHWTFLQGVHKTHYLNPYVNSAENKEYARDVLAKLRKPVLTGITSALRALAYGIRDGRFPRFKPSAILTGGETLNPKVRELLESTFGIKVTDKYACNEAGDVAWQCRRANGYHINADNCIVEILNDERPAAEGQVGEVVITNLNRFVMPIIRYKNGDLARLTTELCSCGSKLPMIAQIAGRTGEDILLPSGKIVLWNQLKSFMNHPHVRQFQLVQNRDGSFTVRYVPEQRADIEQLDDLLLYRYRTLMGDSIRIKIEKTSSIPPAVSGKSKLVISDYKLNNNDLGH
jgi:phenylacetate-CoA ligase